MYITIIFIVYYKNKFQCVFKKCLSYAKKVQCEFEKNIHRTLEKCSPYIAKPM